MTITSPMQRIDTSDAPFAPPPVIVFDLPAPPSVNRTRRVDWKSLRLVSSWKNVANNFVIAQRRRQPRKIYGAFEILIVMSEKHTGIDLDNGIKSIIDYMREIDAIQNDAPQFLRKLTVEWGDAPEGCRVHVRGLA